MIRLDSRDLWFGVMTFLAIDCLCLYIHESHRTETAIKRLDVDEDVIKINKENLDRYDSLRFPDGKNVLQEYQDQKKAADDAKKAQQDKLKKAAARAQFINTEINCLAENIYRESAWEPESGQLAVATVTMNRVKDPKYPGTVCGVVYERHIKKSSGKIVCMFSWSCMPRKHIIPKIYNRILVMARSVYLKHQRNDDIGDATMYHASYITPPNWADVNNEVATIGLHVFYRQ